ncbi:hypothetical protein DFH08DRAFT_1078377 [Mycena albidolilacea]|uniref:Uncharacterized protein n=1 Tax=Mycena albidolilacea TaxID=1033008 RepID=A0AAD7A7D9_9AGAR|nr:hypothetical protein DFH08DRAFT_1078377 [Mycena albidolilacea]
MLFKVFLSIFALASTVVAVPKEHAPVFTATRVYKTLTDVAPFIVTGTTTVTWTQSPSTVVATPTGPGLSTN